MVSFIFIAPLWEVMSSFVQNFNLLTVDFIKQTRSNKSEEVLQNPRVSMVHVFRHQDFIWMHGILKMHYGNHVFLIFKNINTSPHKSIFNGWDQKKNIQIWPILISGMDIKSNLLEMLPGNEKRCWKLEQAKWMRIPMKCIKTNFGWMGMVIKSRYLLHQSGRNEEKCK